MIGSWLGAWIGNLLGWQWIIDAVVSGEITTKEARSLIVTLIKCERLCVKVAMQLIAEINKHEEIATLIHETEISSNSEH
jgi:hypothetical protein